MAGEGQLFCDLVYITSKPSQLVGVPKLAKLEYTETAWTATLKVLNNNYIEWSINQLILKIHYVSVHFEHITDTMYSAAK